jgi:SpoVK/Ycf46/Vps4 family AAA+-type ATPase
MENFAPQSMLTTTRVDGAVMDYGWNLAASGLLAGSHLCNVPLAATLLETAGEAPGDVAALRDHERAARLVAAARAHGALPRPVPAAETRAERNLALAAAALGLGPVEHDVVRFLVAGAQSWELNGLLCAIRCRSIGMATRVLAAAVGHPLAEVERAVRPAGRLVAAGFVTLDHHSVDADDAFRVDHRLLEIASASELDAGAVLERFLPPAPEPTLSLADYPQLATDAALAARLLAAALDRRSAGVNVLIHGSTGAGKTELARVLARLAGARLFVAGKEDDEGLPPDSRERLAALRLGQRVLAGTRALLIFDELEDLFVRDNWSRAALPRGRDSARMSKLWFNHLLETTPVPTIWLSNDVSAMDPAFLRRFAVALELRPPSLAQRKRVWARHLGEDLALPDEDVERLATRFSVSPAQIETATRAARLAGAPEGLRATLERILDGIAPLAGARGRAPRLPGAGYDPVLSAARVDLEALAARLDGFRETAEPGVSLCLHGPPGTGKSEFVRHLARRLDRQLVLRRASDLLSMWVGGTERQLAAAFAEAREERAILLIDEADSFLRDRRLACRSWEVTQVNELLQQLEDFEGIVACTTNLFEDLDQAAMRRFTFRIPFDYLPAAKARRLLRQLLAALGVTSGAEELAAADATIGRLSVLTPGDFAVVGRRLRALGGAADARSVAAELEEEAAAKGRKALMGFGV